MAPVTDIEKYARTWLARRGISGELADDLAQDAWLAALVAEPRNRREAIVKTLDAGLKRFKRERKRCKTFTDVGLDYFGESTEQL